MLRYVIAVFFFTAPLFCKSQENKDDRRYFDSSGNPIAQKESSIDKPGKTNNSPVAASAITIKENQIIDLKRTAGRNIKMTEEEKAAVLKNKNNPNLSVASSNVSWPFPVDTTSLK